MQELRYSTIFKILVIMQIQMEHQEFADKLIAAAYMVFTLDFNTLKRIDQMGVRASESSAKKIMIDHHQEPDDYADIMFSNPSIGSTCEFVFQIIEGLGLVQKINKDIASSLYTGIVTDTGSFRFPSVTAATHRAVATLIDGGANHSQIHEKIKDNARPERLKLLGIALNNMVCITKYKTAYITLSQEELDACNYQKGDTEGFVNYGLSIAGIEMQYRHRQRFIMKKNRKLLLGSKYPTLTLEYRRGIPNWFGSNVNYNLLRLQAFDDIQWPRLGYSNWFIGMGSFLGSNLDSIRFIEHKFFRGSDNYLFSNPTNSFQALDSTYHTARPYIEIYGIHHFQGSIFQQIPFVNSLKFEIAVGGSALYIPSLNKNQFETFFGLEKPFKFFDEMLKYGLYYVITPGSTIRQGFRMKIGLVGYDRYRGKWDY